MADETTRLNWVITGTSQGFGKALAVEALSRGDSVLGVVRDPQSVRDLLDRHPDRFAATVADFRQPDAVERVAAAAIERFGAPDVLVNNAGRAIVGAAEELTLDDLRELIEVNFFAAAALTRALLPAMRHNGGGTIAQMSSQGGRLSFPGAGGYSASKFALEGWSEALAGEVRPFGIRVVLVEPSRFRTGFNTPHSLRLATASSAYSSVLDPVREDMTKSDGVQEGDPARAAKIINDMVRADEVPLRLPLGAEAVERIGAAYTRDLTGLRQWADVARSADFPDARPAQRAV